ncbi:MAG: M28 family metallopeptidase, partial [Promethearchaeota archaeon]
MGIFMWTWVSIILGMKHIWLLPFAILLVASIPLGGSAIYVVADSAHGSSMVSADRIYDLDMSGIIHDAVDVNSYLGFIQKLTENGSREIVSPSVYSDANAYARDWLASEFVEVSDGQIEVEIIGQYQSVLGRLPGYLGMGPAFMVGGHFDSVTGAPGANDDATGVATALELAKVMSQYEWPLDIYFGCWNAEEIGLHGSAEVAAVLASRNVDILYYFNVDMLLVPDSEAPPDERVLMVYNGGVEYHLGKYWGDLARMMSNNVGYNMVLPLPSEDLGAWSRSDHMSFIGITDGAVCFYHQSGVDGAYHTP